MGLAVVFSKDQNDASNMAAAAAVDLDPTSTEISVDDLQAQDDAENPQDKCDQERSSRSR